MFVADRNNDRDRDLAKAKIIDPSHPMPYVVKALSRIGNPFSLLLGFKNPGNLLKDLDIAETLALAHPEHAKELDLIRELKQRLASL
jgi:hypothetical protein